jgi:hypothetical protein
LPFELDCNFSFAGFHYVNCFHGARHINFLRIAAGQFGEE